MNLPKPLMSKLLHQLRTRLVSFLLALVLALPLAIPLAIPLALSLPSAAWAFCGFYVAKADTKLYNQASQVAIARDGNRTVLTMANDYQGPVKDFAIVVPVPTAITREQVNVASPKVLERLDAFSAPRLVEYFDPNPCELPRPMMRGNSGRLMDAMPTAAPMERRRSDALGVTVEAQFNVGEYEIVILSAKQSTGLETWLKESGYRIPDGAEPLLRPYIRQQMKFFVAKVNLKEFDKSGFERLRPLQIAYESPKFMLPIRLGMTNAKGEQDLLVYLMSPKGRVDLTNYRTVNMPSDAEVPEFVKAEFGDFYKAMYATAHRKENRKVAFLEYAWSMRGCDPCAAEPLNPEELRQAGVFWVNPNEFSNDVFITRLHVRYSRDRFPEDLMFQETSNQSQFQGRYILRHPFTGETKCQAGQEYKRSLPPRLEREAQTLASLTGWNINEIRRKLPKVAISQTNWWRDLWQKKSVEKGAIDPMKDWWTSLWG
jgi:hypothetical protein